MNEVGSVMSYHLYKAKLHQVRGREGSLRPLNKVLMSSFEQQVQTPLALTNSYRFSNIYRCATTSSISNRADRTELIHNCTVLI